MSENFPKQSGALMSVLFDSGRVDPTAWECCAVEHVQSKYHSFPLPEEAVNEEFEWGKVRENVNFTMF